jgi:regulator of cell morphogenesis and NO signaling
MRGLTGGYTPPDDACTTYRALLDGLADLEADMHRHVHKENNILFPRAGAVEAELRSRAGRRGDD